MISICIFPNDTLHTNLIKGEVKYGYFNPSDIFQEIHIISFAPTDINPLKVSKMFGKARAILHTIGPKSFFGKVMWKLLPEIYYLIRLKDLFNILHNINPCIIRAYNVGLQGFLATYVGKKLQIPVVVSIHSSLDFDFKFIFPKRIIFWIFKDPIKAFLDFCFFMKFQCLGKLLERYCFKSANKVICAYQYPKKVAKKYGRSDASVIYNRVDINKFKPANKVTDKNKPISVLHVGVLTYEKNPENLIRAIKNLPAKLIIVGDGELKCYLMNLVERLNIRHKVQFIHRVSHHMIHQLYMEADIFVACLKVGGISIPMLEAMAAGLPVIYTLGVYESRKEIVHGIGICVNDIPLSIEHALRLLIDKPLLRKQLGILGREKMLEISGDRMAELEANLYRTLINRAKRQACVIYSGGDHLPSSKNKGKCENGAINKL